MRSNFILSIDNQSEVEDCVELPRHAQKELWARECRVSMQLFLGYITPLCSAKFPIKVAGDRIAYAFM